MSLPRWVNLFLIAVGIGIALSAGWGIAMALMAKPTAWFFLEFEFVVLLASIFLILKGKGEFKDGSALTLLCVAGAVGVCSLLGSISTAWVVAGYNLKVLTAIRALVAGGLLLLAAAEVLMRRPSLSMPRIMMGMAMLIPLGIIALMYSIGFVALMTKLGNVNPGLAMLGWIVLLVVVGGMICAAGHAFIRAFQFGVEAANVNSPAASGSKAPTPAPQPRTPPATKD